jgi:Predicted Na+-dependent transporter
MQDPHPRSPRPFLVAALVFGVAYAVAALAGLSAQAGALLSVGFVCASIGCGRSERLGSLSYTLLILGLVCLAMFYPAPLRGFGDFRFVTLIPVLLQLIMFGVGSQMSVKDFEGVVRTPRAVVIGLAAQFTIMPFIGFALSRAVAFDGAGVASALGLAEAGAISAEQATALSGAIAAGVVLIGCSPSGLASNVMCFLARGNLALSVTIAACATLMAPVMTPVLVKLLAGTLVEVSVVAMMHDVVRMLVYPIMAGLLFNSVATAKPARAVRREALAFLGLIVVLQVALGLAGGSAGADIARGIAITAGLVLLAAPAGGAAVRAFTAGGEEAVKRLMAFFSMAAVCTILTVITAANRDSLLKIGLVMIGLMLVHNVAGYTIGYWVGRLFRMDEKSCRTIAFEVGQQNGGLANGLAASLPLDMPVKTLMGIAPAVFGALQNITGSALATWWRGVPIRDLPEAGAGVSDAASSVVVAEKKGRSA